MRRILHIDMDAFFASVEEKRRPGLRGRPVVVGGGGDPTKRGVVSTANYEARKYGIRSAMPLRTALRLCPHAVFLPVDYREYERESGRVKEVLRGFSPVVEDVGIDEAFLDISETPGDPEEVARAIKEKIRAETGLACSVGIAPNKLLAKIASDMEKPDGLTVIREGDVESTLGPLPVRKLWGVGPKTEGYLKEMGIHTVGEVRSLSLEELRKRFGDSFGLLLYQSSRGVDERPLVTQWEAKSTSRETTFERDTGDWGVISRTLAELAREVASEMGGRGLRGRTVTVKIRFSDFKTHTRATTLPEPTGSLAAIRRAAFEDLGRFDLKGKKVRLVGVRVGGLVGGRHSPLP
jgi:DNA polymerase-4